MKYNINKLRIDIDSYSVIPCLEKEGWNDREVVDCNIKNILKSQIVRYYNTFNNLPSLETWFYIDELEFSYILKHIMLKEDDSFILIFDTEVEIK